MRSITSAGSAGTREGGMSSRASADSSHPSAATLNTPGRSRVATSTSAATRSSTCTTCTGNSAPRTRSGGRPSRMRAGRRSAPGPTTGADRNVVTVTPGCSARQSARRRSTSAPCTAGEKWGLGRNGAVSVSGTGLFGHAPYTVALEIRTTRRTPTDAAASSTWRVPPTLTPRHELDVGHRVDDTGKVHHDVDALEHAAATRCRRCRRARTRHCAAAVRARARRARARGPRRDARRAPAGGGDRRGRLRR